MKKFIVRSLPFVLVIFLYLGIGEYLMYRISENVPVEVVVKKQLASKTECYYGRTLFENVEPLYKFEMLSNIQPSIVVLGSSVVFNFRDFFFQPFESKFYNTGLMLKSVRDLNDFVNHIKKGKIKKPAFVIIGIDNSLIKKVSFRQPEGSVFENFKADPICNYKEHLRAIQDVYLRSDVREVPEMNYGFGKKGMVGDGYRKDGSFSYKWELDIFLKDSTHYEGDLKAKLREKRDFFTLPLEVDSNKKEELIKVLKEFKKLNIELLLYFPPFSDEFYNIAKEDKVFNQFFGEYLAYQSLLEKEGFDMIKFTTPSRIGLNDYYMANAYHPGDIMVAKQLLTYSTSPERKNKFIDKLNFSLLDSLVKSSNNPLSFMRDTLVY